MGRSSKVQIYILVSNKKYPINNTSPTHFWYEGKKELPPNTHAKLVMLVDKSRFMTPIILENGAKPGEKTEYKEYRFLCHGNRKT